MSHAEFKDADTQTDVPNLDYDATARGGALRALDGVARLHGGVAAAAGVFAVVTFFLPWSEWTPYGPAPWGTQTTLGISAAPWQFAMTALATLLCVAVTLGKARHRSLALAAFLFASAALFPASELWPNLSTGHERLWPLRGHTFVAGGAALVAWMGALATWRSVFDAHRKRRRRS